MNPEALEIGKEVYEAKDDFVVVMRVLSREEVQNYAEITNKIRSLSHPHMVNFLYLIKLAAAREESEAQLAALQIYG